jgi:hypothetical protein
MDQKPSAKVPAIVRLAGWIILAFSLFGLNPVGVVAGILILRYADRIAGRIAETSALPGVGRAAKAQIDRSPPGRDAGGMVRREGEILIGCPFCQKMNKANTGKCRSCGYTM